MLAGQVDELPATSPSEAVRLVGAFDAYVLGGGTTAVEVIPAARRAEVSRPGGWVSPVVLRGVFRGRRVLCVRGGAGRRTGLAARTSRVETDSSGPCSVGAFTRDTRCIRMVVEEW